MIVLNIYPFGNLEIISWNKCIDQKAGALIPYQKQPEHLIQWNILIRQELLQWNYND